MNNLKELAADEMNSCISVLMTFCGEPYHSHAQLNVHVFFRCLQTGASGRLSLYAFDLKVLFHHGCQVLKCQLLINTSHVETSVFMTTYTHLDHFRSHE